MILPNQYLKMIYYFSISPNGIIEMLSKQQRQDLSFTIINIKLNIFIIFRENLWPFISCSSYTRDENSMYTNFFVSLNNSLIMTKIKFSIMTLKEQSYT